MQVGRIIIGIRILKKTNEQEKKKQKREKRKSKVHVSDFVCYSKLC